MIVGRAIVFGHDVRAPFVRFAGADEPDASELVQVAIRRDITPAAARAQLLELADWLADLEQWDGIDAPLAEVIDLATWRSERRAR
jgi:hypothetical protein